MPDQIGLFLILVLLWVGFRFLFRRWVWKRVNRGDLTYERALLLYAATFAALPLLALPWATSTGSVLVLVAVAIALFVFQVALARLYRWFLARNS